MDLPHIHVRRAGSARTALLTWLLVLFPSLCEAREPWEFTDYALTGAALAALAVDWGQTRHIAKNPSRFDEKNPLLGTAPSVGKVDTYFVGAMLGTVAVARLLPRDYRRLFLAGTLSMELSVIDQNRSIGVKIEF
jgi:hypothetical protein